jgi:ABC-type transport system involved in multi-copper enzyme maturation permease subunit
MALWTLDNPVITKELRGRMRGARTYWLLFGYLLLLSLILFFSYLGWWNSHSNAMDVGGASAGFTVGRTFFKTLFYSQAVMIALITPALTAGAISIEREQRTYEMLRGTVLRPGSIVWGKLASSVSFVALLLTSSLPLLSLCFLLGGVSPGEVFFAYILLLGDAFLFGAIGLCWSAYAANTATATVLSYATLILFFAATFPFAIPVLEDNSFTPNFGLCALNPVGAVTGAVVPEHYYGWTLPAWLPAILLNGTLSALLVLACINRLEDFPARRATALRLVTLLFAGLIVFFGDGVLLGLPAGIGVTAPIQMLMLLCLACALLLLFVPVLVTGDLEWVVKRFRLPILTAAWSPRQVFGAATLPSGLPFALLLTALVLGMTVTATHLYHAAPAVLAFPSYVSGIAPGGPGAALNGALPAITLVGAPVMDILQQSALLLVLIIVGISGVGFLFSTLLDNRWASLTLLYLALILAVTLPFFSYAIGLFSGSEALAAAARNPGVNSLYLCPFIAIWQLTDKLDPHSSFAQNPIFNSMIGYGVWPLWLGTGLIYLAFGLASYAAALTVLRRRSRVRTA